ncbi:MAG: SAM-dependent methyltransferase [Burkholderiales bacterium]|nr:SAM-dependent methyltransferase [Burkholderiales bacterium]
MTDNNAELFQLSPEEHQLTQKLQNIINHEIEQAGGTISFARYMELALYYPSLGYYSNPLFKFGAGGDFITAPLISDLFGQLIARQISELFSFGVAAGILEFGAGNGKLACDILMMLGAQITHYYILELSADLALWQRAVIAEKCPEYLSKVVWLESLPERFNGVMLANEVLDAQPCNLVRVNNQEITELGIGYSLDFGYFYHDYRSNSPAVNAARELNLPYLNYQTEINLSSRGFIRSLSESLERGAILLIDYGYGESEYYHPQKNRGTLRGFYRQQVLDSVLYYPGICDITASVDWSSIVSTALDSGLEFIGYTTQANFLLNCGLAKQMQQLKSELSEPEYLKISNQINKLVSPNEMGESFKVCGFSKNIEQDEWLGFSSGDRSYSL